MSSKAMQTARLVLFLVLSLPVVAQGQKDAVSDAELQKFADAFQKMRMINQEVQRKMTEVVEAEEMQIQRFNEIHKATIDPALEPDLTEEEQKMYDSIISELEKAQKDFQKRMEALIKDSGLSLERYQQIARQLQTDAKLQQRLRAHFQS